MEAILASLAVGVFAFVVGPGEADAAATRAGFQAVVYMYCIAIVAIAVGLFFFMPGGLDKSNQKEERRKEGVGNTWSAIVRIVRIPEVWVMMVIIFCGYTLFWAHYYFSGYLNVNHGRTQVAAGVVTVVVLWMRPVGGFGGGWLADRFGRSRVLSWSMIITAALLIALALIPGGAPMSIVYAILVGAGLVMYVIRGVYWSILDETRVPIAATGIAIGLISFFGYLPDIVLPQVSSWIYTSYGDDVAGANNMYFVVSAVIGLVGALAAVYFGVLVRRRARVTALNDATPTAA